MRPANRVGQAIAVYQGHGVGIKRLRHAFNARADCQMLVSDRGN